MGTSYGKGLQTRYLSPTNYRPSRVSCWELDSPQDEKPRRVVVNYDTQTEPGEQGRDPHEKAVREWIRQHGIYTGKPEFDISPIPLFHGSPFAIAATGIERGYVFTLLPVWAVNTLTGLLTEPDALIFADWKEEDSNG